MSESAQEMLARFKETYLKNNQQERANIDAVLKTEKMEPKVEVEEKEPVAKVEKEPMPKKRKK